MAVMSKTPTGRMFLVEETKGEDTYRKAFHYRENAVGFVRKKMKGENVTIIGDSVWVCYEKKHKCVVSEINFYDWGSGK